MVPIRCLLRRVAFGVSFLALTAALGACGGGGGGTGAGPAAPAVAYATGRYGKAQAVYLPNLGAGSAAITDRSPVDGQTLTYSVATPATSTTQGTAKFSVGPMAGGTTMVGSTTGMLLSVSPATTLYVSSDSTTVATVSTNAGTNALLTDAGYGRYWVYPASGQEQVGGFFTGTPTSQSQMPGNITATYTGGFTGYRVAQGQGITSLKGSSSLTADFGAGTVNGTISNLVNGSNGLNQTYGLSLAGNITGNTYNGTVGFTNAAPGVASGTPVVASSALNGAFYGNGATQTAGSLSITGQAPSIGGAIGPVTVVGGFGGRR